MQVAPSGYWKHAARLRNPDLRCRRDKTDEQRLKDIYHIWNRSYRVYGARKVWHQMKRDNKPIARCTVERLMRQLGIQGIRRGKKIKTTFSNNSAPCPQDLVNRKFKVSKPNSLWVADFTYVSTWQGWLYVAFVVDAFKKRIVGWRTSSYMTSDFVLDALEQALYERKPSMSDNLVHHSDRGSQYVSIKYSERLKDANISPSVGSTGDAYDNALAETINGLYKTEVINNLGPWKTKAAVELATLKWVYWFNNERLLSSIGNIPPAEAEKSYYDELQNDNSLAVLL